MIISPRPKPIPSRYAFIFSKKPRPFGRGFLYLIKPIGKGGLFSLPVAPDSYRDGIDLDGTYIGDNQRFGAGLTYNFGDSSNKAKKRARNALEEELDRIQN
jgi:hypothetical protein